MLDNRGFKVVVAFVWVVLWLLPQEVLGEDVEIKNRLSYISKVVGVIEGSIIKIEGDVRFVKRQTEKTTAEAHLSCLLYTSPSPRDVEESRMPSSA